MTTDAPQPPDRHDELCIDHALHGLTEAERRELASLDPTFRDDDIDAFDLAAGAAAAAFAGAEAATPMPEAAERRARMAASAWDAARAIAATTSPGTRAQPAPRRTFSIGWVAAAACLVVAAMAWLPPGGRVAPAPRVADLSTASQALLRDASDAVAIPWTATEDPAAAGGVTGEVVWSDERNEGYMHIKGLAANDAQRDQYQLWVFDADRDDRYPVDGGVFDIPAGADEVIIPITTKVHVDRATLFAVTVERPGGVVVSSRERLPILAKVEKG